jgi:hypothetical protein
LLESILSSGAMIGTITDSSEPGSLKENETKKINNLDLRKRHQ